MLSRSRGGTAALLLAGALALSGCGGGAQTARGAADGVREHFDEGGTDVQSIRERPSFEATLAEFGEAEERVKAAITEILPGAEWELTREHDTSPCRENEGQDDDRAVRLYGTMWALPTVPTEQQWAQIRERVTSIIADYGFSGSLMDTPTANGAVYKVAGVYEGSVFSVAYKQAVVVSAISGCHLPEG